MSELEYETPIIGIGDGLIDLDTVCANLIGFRSEYFGEESYLWKIGNDVYISFIESKKPGNFRRLVERLQKRGYTVKVPTPLGRMREIVQKHGVKTWELIEKLGESCEVWILNTITTEERAEEGEQ